MPTQEKVAQVAEITEQFQNTAGCWFIDARGLTVKEVQELRRNIREGNGQMHVYKNKLAARALADLGLPELPEVLSGPTAFVFCDDDIAAPAKAVKDFMDEHEALELKGGLVDGKEVSVEDALKIAELPSKEQLIAMLLSTMQAPLTGLARVCNGPIESFARVVKAIADKETDQAA